MAKRADEIRDRILARREAEIDQEVASVITSEFLNVAQRRAERELDELRDEAPTIAELRQRIAASDDPVEVAVLAGYWWSQVEVETPEGRP